ncbi:MAG: cobalamin-dependent protein [Deltaproteobacteria bacterium]|nr:cobalamin-dependent protein [Deltaproteobacteria bacterium]
MRVLLVQGYLGRRGVADPLVYPLGLACVASALERAGHAPWIVDPNVADDWVPGLVRAIAQHQPEVVGISLRNLDSANRRDPAVYHTWLEPAIARVRREAPQAPVVLGGPGFTQAARTLMERYACDLGVQAEAEDTLPALLASLDHPERVPGAWWRDGSGRVGRAVDRPMPDLATLPFPRRDHVDWEPWRRLERTAGLSLDVGVETTRGCPRRCAYCTYPYLNGRVLRRKPPSVVADEIAYLHGTFGVERFTFTDSRFNEDPPHARAVCEALVRRRLPVRWTAWLGFDRIDAEFLELMRDAGCERVSFSPDGLLQPSLDRLQKDTTTAEIAASVRAVRRVRGLKASWAFFATPPATSWREQAALAAYYAWIHGTIPGRGRMMLTWCRVEAHTRLEAIAREDGVLPEDADLLPEETAALERLFYVAPGFGGASDAWDRLLDAERAWKAASGRFRTVWCSFLDKDLTKQYLKR